VFEGFPGGSAAKNLPAMQGRWVGFLDQDDPLEKKMATHSSALAWEIPWTEKPGGLQQQMFWGIFFPPLKQLHCCFLIGF